MTPGLVTIGYLHPGELKACFARSLSEMVLYDMATNGRFAHASGEMALEAHATGIVDGRNQLAAAALASEAEWLFMVDADMGFAPDTVDMLVSVADPELRPVVGGLAFAHKSDGKGPFHARRYRPTPTVYRMWQTDDDLGFVPLFDYPRNELVEIDATGMACVLIHRTVLERMRTEHGDRWFDIIEVPNGAGYKKFGEDLSFCLRAKALGYPLFVHTGIQTTHDKGGIFQDEEQYDRHQLVASLTPPETTIDILIPSLGRPHRISELVENIKATTATPVRIMFIFEAHDAASIEEARRCGAEHVINDRAPSYAGAINCGFAATSGEWVFTGADDLVFVERWDTELLTAAQGWFTVLGTNDQLNGRVKSGRHATHSLVSRRWLMVEGGVLDEGPGSFLHEGYDHNFVDHEFVSAAKMRGRFRPVLTSIVTHAHHLNGMAPSDATYEKSMRRWDQDQKLFSRRAGLWAGL